MIYRPFLVLCALLSIVLLKGNCQQPYGFERYDDIEVFDDENIQLAFPWVGGFNAVQFNTIDLNNDDLSDLICFDRLGNRILTFINENQHWKYAPEYQKCFPKVEHWIILKDYDDDGKKDLFTYTIGGIKVFHNVGVDKNVFELVTDPYLTSLQGSIYTNILVTYADYPGIIDIDYDGDLDILTFWGLGSFVEMHKNLSMETYGHADSLLYEKTTYCWGHFAESEESNELFLDTCVNTGVIPPAPKHTGSTFLLFDKDQDNDYDLLLGDVDYPTLAMLENGGDSDEAHMISQTLDYPPSKPVFQYSFPAAFLEDVDFDGQEDLLVTPFDPSPDHSVVNNNIFLYKNYGNYDFHFVKDDFLQSDMIDLGAGAYPCFFDFNSDGLLDLLVGNEGVNDTCFMDQYFTLFCYYKSSLKMYLNTGSSMEPAFTLVDNDFGNLEALDMRGFVPAAGDVDNDGDVDVICGNENGSFIWIENMSGGYPSDYEIHIDAFDGLNVDHYSAPDLFDIDDDGDLDLISGCRDGFLYLFENESTGNVPLFELSGSEFGDVDVRDLNVSYYGYSTPDFMKNDDSEIELFVGSGSGRIYMYDDIDNNLSGAFNLLTNDLHYLDPGERSDCDIADLNGDGYPEIIVGNYSGGLTLYKGVWPPSGITNQPEEILVSLYPNPAKDMVYIQMVNDENSIINIYNLNGKLINSVKMNQNEISIDVSRYKGGVYFIELITQERTDVQKLIIP